MSGQVLKGVREIILRVFFDIDGTLLLTDGAGRAALRRALELTYGTTGPLAGYNFHGKTDPQIVVELLTGAGVEEEEIRLKLPSVWPVYLQALERELEERRARGRIVLLPGVKELLAALERRPEIKLGLLTGNIEPAARLKLAAAGVSSRFDVGGYGSDSEVRVEIARIAVARCRAASGAGEAPAVVVVGDTPEDIACARAVSATAVAVATGRHSVAELEAAGADAVFQDFSDSERVVEYVLETGGVAGAKGTPNRGGGDELRG